MNGERLHGRGCLRGADAAHGDQLKCAKGRRRSSGTVLLAQSIYPPRRGVVPLQDWMWRNGCAAAAGWDEKSLPVPAAAGRTLAQNRVLSEPGAPDFEQCRGPARASLGRIRALWGSPRGQMGLRLPDIARIANSRLVVSGVDRVDRPALIVAYASGVDPAAVEFATRAGPDAACWSAASWRRHL